MAIAMNPIKMLITPILNLYLDIFVGAIQAFVFITLTISYWSQASEEEVKEKIKSKVKQAKEKLLQNENKELNGEPQVNLIQ
jgi:ATP synthase subunit a